MIRLVLFFNAKCKMQNYKPEKNSMFFSGFLMGIMGVMGIIGEKGV